MSFVTIGPEFVEAAAHDLAGIGSSLRDATAAAAAPTTGMAAAGADEVSAAISALFGGYGQEFQALAADASAFHAQFVSMLNSGAGAYCQHRGRRGTDSGEHSGRAGPDAVWWCSRSSGLGSGRTELLRCHGRGPVPDSRLDELRPICRGSTALCPPTRRLCCARSSPTRVPSASRSPPASRAAFRTCPLSWPTCRPARKRASRAWRLPTRRLCCRGLSTTRWAMATSSPRRCRTPTAT